MDLVPIEINGFGFSALFARPTSNDPTLQPLNLITFITNDHMTRCIPDEPYATPNPTRLVESIPTKDKAKGQDCSQGQGEFESELHTCAASGRS